MSKTASVTPSQLVFTALMPMLAITAMPAAAADMVALDRSNRLITFTDTKPGVTQSRLIKGASAAILGIDVRPSNGKLYGFAADGAVYQLDPTTGQATMISKLNVAPAGDATVVDFNPVADRMRVVTASGRSLRINVDTGETVEDGKLNYAAGDPSGGKAPNVTAGGYINSAPGPKPAATALYEIDSTAKALLIQDPPNAGTLQTKAKVKLPARALHGLDIATDASGKHTGYAVTGAKLYRVDIASGQIVKLGNVGKGEGQLVDVAVLAAK